VWPVKAKSSGKEGNVKVCGHYGKIDGYWCFVERFREKQKVYEKNPIEQHLQELEKARNTLRDLVAMNSKDFVRSYSH
jgi:hypothetical protein